MASAAITQPFARFGLTAKTKLLLLGSRDFLSKALADRARSFPIEHVSPAIMTGREISSEDAVLACMRRWFFGRKPDAGFILADFPATLLQARVFDEWLDVRGEALDAVLAGSGAHGSLVSHYRTLGLLAEAAPSR